MAHWYRPERAEYGSGVRRTVARLHHTMVYLVLFAVALAARLIVGALFDGPAYPDSYYYVGVARELAAGNGFRIDYVWNFIDVGGQLPAAPSLPIASNAHWMPLAALVQVPFIWLLGPSSLASALPFWIIGALAAPLAYLIAIDAGLGRSVALTAGLLTAAPAALTPFMAQPDNFGLFMTLGAVALWLAGRAMRGDARALVVAGLVAGLAMMARNDGLLLAVPLGLGALALLRAGPDGRRTAMLSIAGCGALFTLVVGPWLLRQLVVFGSLSPSASGGRVLWLTDYGQLWSIGDAPTLADLLASGLGPLLASRLDGLLATGTILAVAPLVVVLVPFALIGAWHHRRDPNFVPFLAYAVTLVAVSALLFTAHVRFGMFMHSLVALLPHAFVLVAIGVGRAVEWLGQWRREWRVVTATRNFRAAAVAIAVMAATIQTASTVGAWQQSEAPRRELASAVAGIPTGERVMSADPGAYNYLYGLSGVVTPNDPLPVIEEAARAYGVRWLVLERAAIVPALIPVLRGEQRPDWLSPPIASVAGDAADGAPAAALFAVCLEPADERCTP
jgi:4-amino-4-deoxy-L-arabinose transferase-like glycosyltransferase